MIVQCSCGRHIAVQPHAVGLRIVCPDCGGIVLIRAPEENPFTDINRSDSLPEWRRTTLRRSLSLALMGALLFLLLGGLLAMLVELYRRMNPKPPSSEPPR
jgi:hypothetical protein